MYRIFLFSNPSAVLPPRPSLPEALRPWWPRCMDEDTLAPRPLALGEDHPDTITLASTLAEILRALGDYRAALELDDTLARRRRVLGEDHPCTLTSASNLTAELCARRGLVSWRHASSSAQLSKSLASAVAAASASVACAWAASTSTSSSTPQSTSSSSASR